MVLPRASLRGSLVVAVFVTAAVSLLGVAAQRALFSRALRSAAPAHSGPIRPTPGEYRVVSADAGIHSGDRRLARLFCRDDPHDDVARIAAINSKIPRGEKDCSLVQSGRLVATGTWLVSCQTGALYCLYCAELLGPWEERVVFSHRVGTKGGDAEAVAACRRLADDPVCRRLRDQASWRCALTP